MTWWIFLILLLVGGVVLFKMASGGRVRVVYEDFEARLKPVEGSDAGGRGKAERERFKGDAEELQVRLYELALPEGTTLEVVLRDESIGHATVNDGRAVLLLENKSGASVPKVQAGDRIEVRRLGSAILRGVFKED